MGERIDFLTNSAGIRGCPHAKKIIKCSPSLTAHTKNNSEWIIDLNEKN